MTFYIACELTVLFWDDVYSGAHFARQATKFFMGSDIKGHMERYHFHKYQIYMALDFNINAFALGMENEYYNDVCREEEHYNQEVVNHMILS